MFLNINVGILGHVDSGKTTLARALSEIKSTAAFDKHPQSKERGITLDLGFSAVPIDIPDHFSKNGSNYQKLLLTLVDCPGHSSLIRTIIGGAQIIDVVLLVIDIQKGIQTQTAECLIISEITCNNLMIVINKIDLIDRNERYTVIKNLESRIRKVLNTTKFGSNIPIVSLSALEKINIEEFFEKFKKFISFPQRDLTKPFLFYFDHCFSIKGKGTIFTGTILQGKISINDKIEIPLYKEQKKIKSMQIFHEPIQTAGQGDRVGICIPQFDSSTLERGILCEIGYVEKIAAVIIDFNKVKYYKFSIKSKSKFHISSGHETIMGRIILFHDEKNESKLNFELSKQYRYIDEYDKYEDNQNLFALIEFETPILTILDSLVIGSKLDVDKSNICRLAFYGHIKWIIPTNINLDLNKYLIDLKIYKEKIKKGIIQRVVNKNEIIVENLFKKSSKRELFLGKKINLSSGEEGFIESNFGQTTKVKIRIPNGLHENSLEKIKSKNNDIVVLLQYKVFIFNKNSGILQ